MAVKYRGCIDTSKGKPKTVCLLSTAHAAQMTNTTARDQGGNIVQKPTCILSHNAKMGGVDMNDQQLHSLTVMRKSYKWTKKVFVHIMMMCVLSAHKLYYMQGGRHDFLQFVHDVITLLLVESPRLINRSRLPRDNILCLTGRHFPGLIPYEGPGKKRKSVAKMCRVCYAQGKHLANGRPIYTSNVCIDCPGNPGLCSGDCFRKFHTVFDFSQ